MKKTFNGKEAEFNVAYTAKGKVIDFRVGGGVGVAYSWDDAL